MGRENSKAVFRGLLYCWNPSFVYMGFLDEEQTLAGNRRRYVSGGVGSGG